MTEPVTRSSSVFNLFLPLRLLLKEYFFYRLFLVRLSSERQSLRKVFLVLLPAPSPFFHAWRDYLLCYSSPSVYVLIFVCHYFIFYFKLFIAVHFRSFICRAFKADCSGMVVGCRLKN